jgi:hypothetical protein
MPRDVQGATGLFQRPCFGAVVVDQGVIEVEEEMGVARLQGLGSGVMVPVIRGKAAVMSGQSSVGNTDEHGQFA